jgi:hypothetical protein
VLIALLVAGYKGAFGDSVQLIIRGELQKIRSGLHPR